jgi:F420-non-reducing hydrogenase iron-sulfur subunit
LEMIDERQRTLALFYCQSVPGSSESERQELEKKYGQTLRLFPMPCSGRIDSLHLLRALEEFADAVYVVTCPEGACRYFEGNIRAKKRVALAKSVIESIGLERERLDIVVGSKEEQKKLAQLSEELMERISGLTPSPVHGKKA